MKQRFLALLFVLLFPLVASAQSLAERVVERTLFNGLKILLVERHQVPTISFRIVYKVGGANEVNGITGIAHLYEHMAFKGTEQIGTKNYTEEKKLIDAIESRNERIAQEERKGDDAFPRLLKELKAEFENASECGRSMGCPKRIGQYL